METTPNGIPFLTRYLCCSETFTLYPIAGLHTQADVRDAKLRLLSTRDVETVQERYDFSRDIIGQVATDWQETDEGPTVAHWNSRQCQTKTIALITTGYDRYIMTQG